MAKQWWGGKGLPPVGEKCRVLHEGDWRECEILAHYRPCKDGPVVAVYAYEYADGRQVGQKIQSQFRTSSSQAAAAIAEEIRPLGHMRLHDRAEAIYAAIRDGRIPGVRLDCAD